jgi:hypothetical protein
VDPLLVKDPRLEKTGLRSKYLLSLPSLGKPAVSAESVPADQESGLVRPTRSVSWDKGFSYAQALKGRTSGDSP